MTLPGALLAAFGGGASELGSDLATRETLAAQQRRQQANDALQRLIDLQKVGGQELQPGQTAPQAVGVLTQQNNMASGLNAQGTAPSAIPNQALGIPDSSTPASFGAPRSVQIPGPDGQMRTVIIDPSKTPEALAEKRASLAQIESERRAQLQQSSQMAIEQQKEQAKVQAQQGTNLRAYNALKIANPDHPLVQVPPDPNTDYTKELDAEIKGQRDQAIATAAANKPVTPYQKEMVDLYRQRLSAVQAQNAAKAAKPTQDQLNMQGIQDVAEPAAATLTKYLQAGGAQGIAPAISGSFVGKIPLIGNKLANLTDNEQSYQNATTAAHTLAVQITQAMRGARLGAPSIDELMKQFAPEPGKDSNPSLRAQKLQNIANWQKLIAHRANLRPDATLDDAPEPPPPEGTP